VNFPRQGNIFFFPQKSKYEHCTLATTKEKTNGQSEKNTVLHNILLACLGRNFMWELQIYDVGHQLTNTVPGTW